MPMLLERTSYHPRTGRFDQVLQARIKACAIRRSIGLPAGTIHVADITADAPPRSERLVQWELDYRDEDAQRRDMAARAQSPAFAAVREEMRSLIVNFSRALIRPVPGRVLADCALNGLPIVPRELRFRSGGLDLAGYLYLPPGKGPFACMIVNHGSGIQQGSTDVCRPGTAAVLMGWGLAVMMPHRRGYGNSPGVPWRQDVSAEFGTADYDRQIAERLMAESADVVAALDHVASLPEIDSAHIGVMGSSFGGTVTLLAAADCPRFRCAVEFAGAAMNWDKTPGLRELMHRAAARLSQPTFFAQAENDYSTRPTVELAAGLEGSGKTIRHRIYPGFGLTNDEGHFLFGQGADIWGADVRAFLEDWL